MLSVGISTMSNQEASELTDINTNKILWHLWQAIQQGRNFLLDI